MTHGAVGGAATGGTDPLWAITAYFNPVGYRRRRENFRIFRARLQVPLVAVELGFEGRFDLRDADADILIRVADGDVMFQKEQLLNLAVQHVPAECRHVAWLDSDIVFERGDWMDDALDALSRHGLVQLFGQVDYMPAGWTGAPGDASEVYVSGRALDAPQRRAMSRARRSGCGCRAPGGRFIRRASPGRGAVRCSNSPGCTSACIVGGGDSALLGAVFDDVEHLARRQEMGPAQEASYQAWAGMFRAAAGEDIGFVEGRIFHLWHGDMESRRIGLRHAGFGRFDFDPAVDIAKGADGAWRWSSPKPAMHAYVADYFVARREDA